MVGMKTARSGRYPVALAIAGLAAFTYSRVAVAQAPEKKPNILVIFGDDIGQTNISAYSLGAGGLQDAEHRPHRQGRHDVHRLLRREQLHGGPLVLHHRPDAQAHRTVEGRHPGRAGRPPGARHHDRPGAEAARLRDRPVRQEPSRRPRRVPAHQPRLRRVLRQPLPPERRGGARAPVLAEGRHGLHQGQLAARRACHSVRRRQDRGHRSARPQADGDDRRRDDRRRDRLHGAGRSRRASRSSSG